MKKIIWNIIKYLMLTISVSLSIYLIKVISDLGILPNKYFIPMIIIIIVLNGLGILGTISKKIVLNIISIVLFVIISVVSIIGINYGSETINFFKKALNNNNLEVTGYSVIVLDNGKYNNISDLNGKTMGYLSLDEQKSKYMAVLKSKVTCEYEEYVEVYQLYEDLLDKRVDSLILDEAYIDMLKDEYEDIESKVKVIYNFEIESSIEKNNEDVKNLKPINILISGSDSRSGKIVTKTRSDVNMIMTINPKTHTILLTSIPRDYYVRLHGTTGNKDKLTHAGIYGINMTKSTIEDFMDIKIDYTVKVGFQSVIQIVDLLGGIDIDSDASFYSHCGDGGAERTHVKKGMNHFNGAQALSYARERYAYKEGDVHRVQNQQQVLEAIIAKLSKDKSLLKKYDKLLDSLSALYRTDIPDSYIKLIVKEQLNSGASWKIERQYVTGTGARKVTYSMPGRELYVMIPEQKSIDKATEKIESVLSAD